MIRSSFPPQAATRSFYFAAVLSVIAFATTAQITTAQGPRVRPGRYKIQNVASDKFMDIDRNDGSIRQWEFGNQRSQLWDIELATNGYVYIRSAENGMLLDIAGGNPRDEARLILAPQSGSQSQLWTIDDAGEGCSESHRVLANASMCQTPRGTTESTGNSGGRSRNMPRNFVSRWSQTFPAGIEIGITVAGTTMVRLEEKRSLPPGP
jgi:hypothetical protein